jgi:parallel beta-helix repeat protein
MEKNPLIGKGLVVGTILLFIGSCSIPSTAQDVDHQIPSSRGEWLYVGGSGPGNYTRIQDAINNAAWGSTIFVYSGVYDEEIVISRAISLIGESRNTTIITKEEHNSDNLISLKSDNITISGFALNYSGNFIIGCNSNENYRDIIIFNNIFQANTSHGISLHDCHFCSITQNIFYLNTTGISLFDSENCIITDNFMKAWDSCFGILLRDSPYNEISNNIIDGGTPRGLGITLDRSSFTIVSNNSLFNNSRAIYIISSSNLSILSNHIDTPVSSSWSPLGYMGIQITDGIGILIKNNYISRCQFGIFLEEVWEISITMNTFMKNIVHARFFKLGIYSNTWDHNYWGRPRILPKPIFGLKSMYTIYPGFVVFDWHPAQEPYDIP